MALSMDYFEPAGYPVPGAYSILTTRDNRLPHTELFRDIDSIIEIFQAESFQTELGDVDILLLVDEPYLNFYSHCLESLTIPWNVLGVEQATNTSLDLQQSSLLLLESVAIRNFHKESLAAALSCWEGRVYFARTQIARLPLGRAVFQGRVVNFLDYAAWVSHCRSHQHMGTREIGLGKVVVEAW